MQFENRTALELAFEKAAIINDEDFSRVISITNRKNTRKK